jgi:hypothetical protein
MSDKFVGLARVMAGKYDWRPGQGVRSAAEVFNLIVNENRRLAGLLPAASHPSSSKPCHGLRAAHMPLAISHIVAARLPPAQWMNAGDCPLPC